MQAPLATPIEYLKPSADHWPRIFRILAITSLVFGAIYAAIGAGGLLAIWNFQLLRDPANVPARYWFAIGLPFINMINGITVVAGALRLLRGGPYEMLIYGMRCILLIIATGVLAAVHNIWPILRWPYLIDQFGTVARNAAFPLLVIFILLAHRKAHPTSPFARKPIREEPLPLLRG